MALDLPKIYAAAEAINSAKRSTRLDDLRAMGMQQDIDIQRKTNQRAEQKYTLDQRLANTEFLANGWDQVLSQPPEQQQAAYAALYNESKSRGLVPADHEMPPYDPEAAKAQLAQAKVVLGRARPAAQSKQGKVAEDVRSGVLTKDEGATALGSAAGTAPNSVREFQFAKENGYTGSFQSWVTAGGQSSRPSSVQEWEFYNNLPQSQKLQYLEMKRNPNMQVKDVNQVPTVVAPSVVGGTTQTPLSTLPQVASSASTVKQAEATGSAIGKAEGEIAGGIQTKGANAVATTGLLDIADPLIDVATGSNAGAARDAVASFFGKATDGAQANAQLKVLQAGLMTSMPRMEGPQSDADVRLYREAAGQIGDPTVPAAIKKAALGTVRRLQNKYIERAGGGQAPATAGALGVGQSTTVGGFTVTRKK